MSESGTDVEVASAWKKHLDDESLAWSNAGVEWIEDLETV